MRNLRWTLLGCALLPSLAHAACFQDVRCVIQGHPGDRICAGGHLSACIPDTPIPPPPKPTVVTVSPNYVVLTVLYAPPGTQGGHASSSVSYGSGSNTGSTISATKSFKSGIGISAKATAGGLIGGETSIGASFKSTQSTDDGTSLEIKKATTETIQCSGPGADGINHDHDAIYLWLNPQLSLSILNKSAAWSFTGTGTADIQYVYVSWLKAPATMPPGVATALARNGVTPADYPTILAQDPFANGDVVPGPRYTQLDTTYPYEPPLTAADPVPVGTHNVTSSTTNTTSTTNTSDYQVGLSVSATAGQKGALQVTLSADASWEWSNKAMHSAAAGTTETAQVAVGGPAFGYKGPTDIAVFYDTIYKTFLFRMVDGNTQPSFRGRLVTAARQPVAFRDVVVRSGARTFRTFSDAQGNYRIYGQLPGPVTVSSGVTTSHFNTVEAARTMEMTLVK